MFSVRRFGVLPSNSIWFVLSAMERVGSIERLTSVEPEVSAKTIADGAASAAKASEVLTILDALFFMLFRLLLDYDVSILELVVFFWPIVYDYVIFDEILGCLVFDINCCFFEGVWQLKQSSIAAGYVGHATKVKV